MLHYVFILGAPNFREKDRAFAKRVTLHFPTEECVRRLWSSYFVVTYLSSAIQSKKWPVGRPGRIYYEAIEAALLSIVDRLSESYLNCLATHPEHRAETLMRFP